MRWRNFLKVLIYISNYTVFSQFNVGARVGTQLASIATFRYLEKPKMILVPSGGLLLKYDWRGGLGLQSEVNFVIKGYKSMYESNRTNHFEIPILIRLDVPVPLGENYKAYGLCGPYIGTTLNRKFTFSDSITKRSVENAYRNARIFEFGWNLGAGFMFPYKIGNFFGEFRYSFALTNVTRGYTMDRYRYFGLFIGYLFPISVLKLNRQATTPEKLMTIPDIN